MDKTDVLVTPSVWNETFGYTVAEALSYSVPVIVSSHVGAKDIVPAGAGIVFDDEKELKNAIISLTPKKLESMNQMILKAFQIQTVESFNKELRENVY
jgi:glycosyltransferase involved in cell wall biosynthesis